MLLLLLVAVAPALPEDWPEWRGAGRRGVWTEDGILDRFPDTGLAVKWQVPVHGGFSGPAVAGGRVYVFDFRSTSVNHGDERLQCLDEQTGEVLWSHEWKADYTGIARTYAIGPRATPTVDGDHVYVLGASGILLCLRTADGAELWRRDYQKEFHAGIPVWGFAAAPIVDGNRLICLVGGEPDARIVALDKHSGKEIWRALDGDSEPGYSQPVLLEHGGARQLIVWDPRTVSSLQPETGEVYWQHPFRIHLSLPVATPVWQDDRLLVSSFYNGSLMLDLDHKKPAADVVWQGASDSEIRTDGLHALITTPVIDGDYIYGIGSYGHLRCLRTATGERVWESLDVVGEQARWGAGFIVKQGDRYFINNDAGDLIIARLTPDGYHELDRTHLIEPTSTSGNRRQAGAVNWSHPAYANRHIIARNDKLILRASLAR